MDWRDLVDELDRWADAGRVATLWWRDDDAVAPTVELDRLLTAADGVPISLSVVPGLAVAELADRLSREPQVTILQHGWRHTDHARQSERGQPPSEYPDARAETEVSAELAVGRERLISLFARRALPVFVPPWHQFHNRFLPLLAAHGITAISRAGPRDAETIAGLAQVNVHAVLMQWRGPPWITFFGGIPAALSRIIAHLRSRRLSDADMDEPTGILTHHLVEDAASYSFVAQLLKHTRAHKGALWLDIKDVLPASAD